MITPEMLLLIPVMGAVPHLIRAAIDHIYTRYDQARSAKSGQLLDLCTIIMNKRRAKLTTTSISQTVDDEKYLELDAMDEDLKQRLTNRNMTVRTWNARTFYPSFLHTATTISMVTGLINLQKQPWVVEQFSQLWSGNALLLLDDSYVAIILFYGFYLSTNWNPFWNNFTDMTVHQINRFWQLVYGFNLPTKDPDRGIWTPWWARFCRPSWRDWDWLTQRRLLDLVAKVERPSVAGEEPYDGRRNLVGYLIVVTFVASFVASVGPLPRLYLLGALVGSACRSKLTQKSWQSVQRKDYKQKMKWMPLTPGRWR